LLLLKERLKPTLDARKAVETGLILSLLDLA
jgi:hypothetical protein